MTLLHRKRRTHYSTENSILHQSGKKKSSASQQGRFACVCLYRKEKALILGAVSAPSESDVKRIVCEHNRTIETAQRIGSNLSV